MAGSQASLPPGIKKEITRHPSSLRNLPPQEGDHVEMHYIIKLKAGEQEVDNSRARGQAFGYTVGQGDVIDAFSQCIKTMRKGEQARFTVAPPHAYGEAGNDQLGVSPNSTIILEVELVSCPTREDLFEDGGAVKLEVKAVPEGRYPRPSDEVQVSYTVTLPEYGVIMHQKGGIYKLGGEQIGPLGRVIDKALLSMKRGEEVLLTCQPGYSFASGQYEGKPASVSLALEEIHEVHDMSLGQHDRSILRKRIKEGEGTERIHDTTTVTLDLISVSAGGVKLLAGRRELCFTVGNGQVCDALEAAVVGMRAGDEAILKVDSVEACQNGEPNLAPIPETPVIFHIAIRKFDKVKEKWDLSSAERLVLARQRKEVAMELFKRGRIRLACHLYELIADLFARLDFFGADEQLAAADLRRVAILNRAMCMLKLGNMHLVKELCTTVLGGDAGNPKALFRRARAAVALKEYSEAIADLDRLLELEPNSREAQELMREAKRLRKQNDGKQAKTFAKMCAGLGDMPERTDRREDDVVVMPDLDKEMAKLAALHGLPARRPEVPVEAADIGVDAEPRAVTSDATELAVDAGPLSA